MENWRIYERLIAHLSADEYSESSTVIPNARITGYYSKRKRQIDVLVDYRFNSDLQRRIIIDTKFRKRPIDIKDVEAFEGLMRDVGSQHGILICSNGHTKAAKRRAQEHIGIRLIPEEEIEKFDINSWDACLDDKCNNGLVLWDATPGIFFNGIVSVQCIGKCDECGKFHIWCWTCGNKIALEKEEDWQCSCKSPWFWLTSIEEDIDYHDFESKGAYLILVLGNGNYQVVDRRPL